MRCANVILWALPVLSILGWVPGESRATPTWVTAVLARCNAPGPTITSGNPSEFISCDSAGSSASARVASGVGFVRSEALSSASSSTSQTLSADSLAATRFQDAFVVQALDAGGASVTSGFLSATIAVDAQATTGEFGFASVLWNFSLGSVGDNGRALANGGSNRSSSSGGTFVLSVPWTAGVPVGINLFGNAESIAAAQNGSAFGSADFMHSMYWRGISAVTDAGGTPVASFTALSNEGVDYALAVPEPAAAALTGLVLLAAGTLRGRRLGQPDDGPLGWRS